MEIYITLQIIYTCNTIPLIFFEWLFVAIDKRILEFKTKRTIIFKIFFLKKIKFEGITLSYFKIYYEATLMKTVQYCQWKRQHRSMWQRRLFRSNQQKYSTDFLPGWKRQFNKQLIKTKQNKKTLKTWNGPQI